MADDVDGRGCEEKLRYPESDLSVRTPARTAEPGGKE